MADFSQIACEICRTKKRKCDRKIPTCSQCVHASQTCTYPGTSKRGLPSGYIASIEERLARTEAALLEALSTFHESETRFQADQRLLDMSPATNEKPRELEFNEIRIAKVKEWKAYPLDTQEQQRQWMRYKLQTPGSSARMVPSTHQEEVFNLRSPPDGQQNRQTGLSRKRQRISTESRPKLTPFDNHRPDPTSSTTLSPTRLPTVPTEDGWTVDRTHNAPLEIPMGPAALDLLPQDEDTRSLASHHDPKESESDGTRIIVSGQETRPEQFTSKAKRLSTLHSRKYF